ncbi:unnamed protein product [Sphagnum jensenii]|uniref:Uncharacterized protein n=1 Tax=Sphagnum jensenii TaxID=128206 RepID=A0ABP1A7B0_9BRYO
MVYMKIFQSHLADTPEWVLAHQRGALVLLRCDEPAKHLQNAQQSLKCASKCSHHKSKCNFRAKLSEYCTDSHSLMMHISWLFSMMCLLPSHNCRIDQKACKSLKFNNRKEQPGILDSENLLHT